ncbi:hypothetical protein [Streptomyces sp. ECR3]|uniref:hypothetical protein n=1 Tax=Streptomyces sp. ECR3 TaxID=3400630 RepID=UPI003F194046
MHNKLQQRLRKKHNDQANAEIAKLQESISKLSLNETASLRVRNSLRIHEHHWKKSSVITRLYGLLAGFWFTMPAVITLDSRPGSMRDILGKLLNAADYTIQHAANSADLVTGILRIALGLALVIIYYSTVSFGPIILGFRVGLGFPGIRVPGRKIVTSCHKSQLVYLCFIVLSACADVIGSTGRKRSQLLQAVATKIRLLRGSVRTRHRSVGGFSQHRRRGRVKSHALRVDAYLRDFEESLEEMTDSQIREVGEAILGIAERCTNDQYGNMVADEKLSESSSSERESIRLLSTALAACCVSVVSVYAVNLLGLPSSAEAIAIAASILVTTIVSYGRKAAGKIENIRKLIGS